MNAPHRIPVYSVYANPGHPALALGMIVSYAMSHDGGRLKDTYEFISTPITSLAVARDVVGQHGSGVLLCSHYLWTTKQNLEIAKWFKRCHRDGVTVHGGPSVPKYDYACEAFFEQHECVDIAVRGEGEFVTVEILDRLAQYGARDLDHLAAVSGLAYRQQAAGGPPRVCRTPDRPRTGDLNTLPSPYLNGWFRSDEVSGWIAAILETNRGCPYSCSFCDWGSATLSKIRAFDISRVRAELELFAQHRVPIVWIADANFGIWIRDVEIATIIAAVKRQFGYPRQVVVNYAKNATERLADIIGIFSESGIAANAIISIQTQDPQTLKVIDRSNIKTKRYEELIQIFRSRQLPVSSDVMLGLPGSTLASFKSDLQFCFDRQVYTQVYHTVALPNSPMAHRDYMAKYAIHTDTDGFVLSTDSFTLEDRRQMERLHLAYRVMIGYGLLKYYLYFLQVDHGIKGLDIVDDLQRRLDDAAHPLTWTAAILGPWLAPGFRRRAWERSIFQWDDHSWECWHDEILEHTRTTYGLEPDGAAAAIMRVQRALMPGKDRILPAELELPHDVTGYFDTLRAQDSLAIPNPVETKPLVEHGPGRLQITDREGVCALMVDRSKDVYDSHVITWELTSALTSVSRITNIVRAC